MDDEGWNSVMTREEAIKKYKADSRRGAAVCGDYIGDAFNAGAAWQKKQDEELTILLAKTVEAKNKQIAELKRKLARSKVALDFYGNGVNYCDVDLNGEVHGDAPVLDDAGETARAALAEIKGE